MECIAEMASFSFLSWWPCACLRMRSIAISLKVNEEQVSYCVSASCTYDVCDIISKKLPCKCLRIGNCWFLCFCYFWLNNIVVVGGMVNLISLWYPLMYRDLYDTYMVSRELLMAYSSC